MHLRLGRLVLRRTMGLCRSFDPETLHQLSGADVSFVELTQRDALSI
jgi:hypothetical protein